MSDVIRSELETRLAAFAAAQSPPLPVAWEGIPFTKPTTGGYLEPFLISASTVNPDVAAKRSREVGVFQVNIYFPDGTGSAPCSNVAIALISAFPVVPKTGLVSIEQTPNAARALLDTSGWRVVPVSIKYRYEAIA